MRLRQKRVSDALLHFKHAEAICVWNINMIHVDIASSCGV